MTYSRMLISLLAATVVAAIAAVSLAGEPDRDTIELFQNSQRDLKAGKMDDAIAKLEKVVAAVPDEPAPPFLLARAYAVKKDAEKAMKWFQYAVDHGLLGSYDVLMQIDVDPTLAVIRDSAEYQKLVREKANFGAAPELEATDLDGKPVKLSALRGKPILLVFWSISCGACHTEFDALQKDYQALADKGLVIIGAAPDAAQEQKEDIAKNGWKLTFWRYDTGQRMLPLLYGVTAQATPANFFIDREGRIVRFYPGYVREGDFSYAIGLITKKDDLSETQPANQ